MPSEDAGNKARQFNKESQERLEKLKRIALERGIARAVFIAKKMGDPFLLDELHDALVDELKQQLLSEGKLEEI